MRPLRKQAPALSTTQFRGPFSPSVATPGRYRAKCDLAKLQVNLKESPGSKLKGNVAIYWLNSGISFAGFRPGSVCRNA
jgi:hypothetical protein